MENQQVKNNQKDREEIIKVLERLQEGYTKRDLDNLDEYVEELFAKGDDMVILGTSDREWHLNCQDSRSILEGDWQGWGNFVIDTKNPQIFFSGDTAWFNTKASVQYDFTNDEKDFDNFLGFFQEYFDEKEWNYNLPDKIKLSQMNYFLSHLLPQREESQRQYRWEVRLTGVLTKENDRWIFRQLQFSMPNTSLYNDERVDEYSYYEKLYKKDLEKLAEFNKDKNDDLRTEIVMWMKNFNNDYLDSQIESSKVIDKYFISQNDITLIGTGMDKYNGPLEIKNAVDYHRTQWQALIINTDEAVIQSHNDTAWLMASGLSKRTMTLEQSAKIEMEKVKDIMTSKDTSREKLFKIHRNISTMMKETLRGEDYVLPIRFEAVMLKNEGRWLIHTCQFSYPFDMILEGKTDAATKININ